MSDPTLSIPEDDPAEDLPRAIRRERDARAAETRSRDFLGDAASGPDPPPATVTRIDVPFTGLVVFFLKAAVAAIPAILLLFAIVLVLGALIEWIYPELLAAKITISVPGGR